MRWGIIGPGNIAREFTQDLKWVTQGSPSVVVVLSDKSESAQAFAEEFNVPHAFTDVADFIAIKPDVAYIATPHTLHHEYALQCLQNGIAVLCEKPLAINAKQVKELVDASVSNNAFLMEGMWIRFLPSIQRLITIIQKGYAGKVLSVKASMSYKAPEDPSSRYFDPVLGGGSLLDLGIYPVFLAMLMLGKPDAIEAVGRISETGIDETCSMLFKYSNGSYANLESSIVTQTELSAEVAGERGVIKILPPWNEKPTSIELDIYNSRHISYPCEWEGRGFQYEADEVYRCMKKGLNYSPDFSHQFSIDIVEAMDEVRRQLGVRYHVYE